MFLHSGASLHGHEYSSRPAPGSQQALNRRSPLLRSPFGTPLARSATAPPPHQTRVPPPSHPGQSDQPTNSQQLQPCRPLGPPASTRRSTVDDPVARFQEPDGGAEEDPEKHGPASVLRADVVAPNDDGSCSEASDAGSGALLASTPGRGPRRRRRMPRKSTAFLFARPPPKMVKKRLMKQLEKPKLLLQLHQLSADKRPTPILDVFPASTLAAPAIGGRFAKRFPRVFGVKGDRCELGSQDVILLRSEEYCTVEHESVAVEVPDDDDDDLNRRELVAVLSPLRREDRTEVVLDDGSVWVAEPLPNGSFQFTHTDAAGVTTTARWVRRSLSKLSRPTSPTMSNTQFLDNGNLSTPWLSGLNEYRYTFSVIDPLSRRHPIMATLTQSTLDVLESYTAVSSSNGKCHSHGHGMSSDYEDEDEGGGAPLRKSERQSIPVDVATRNLISVTALWVTLRLSGIMPSPESQRALSLRTSVARSNYNNIGGAFSSPTCYGSPASAKTEEPSPGPQTAALGGGNNASSPALALPRRATSTGAAFMQRRMQIPDANDSERQSPSRIRSKGRRVLSGDWGVAAWKRSSNPPTPAMATATAEPGRPPAPPQDQNQEPRKIDLGAVWPMQPPSPSPGAKHGTPRPGSAQIGSAHAVAQPQVERRTRSAYYTSLAIGVEAVEGTGAGNAATTYVPAHVDPNSVEGALAALEAGHAGSGAAASADMGLDQTARSEKGWKRLSQWIRRFGR